MRSDSYLVGSVLDGGEVKPGAKNRAKEKGLMERIDELLVNGLPGDQRIVEFVKTRAGEDGWDVGLKTDGCHSCEHEDSCDVG